MHPPTALRFPSLFTSLLLLAASQLQAAPGLDAAVPVGKYFNNVFPPTAPGSAGGWTVADAFPSLSFIDPVKMVAAPRSNKLFVLGKDGYVWSFVNSPTTTTKTQVLDIRTRVQSTDNAGLTGLAFHPEFGLSGSANSRYFYMMYYYTPTPLYLPGTDSGADGDGVGEGDETLNHTCIRLSRFTMNLDGVTADPTSEYVYLQQFDRQAWHNGCSLFFGNDSFLYFCIGDEGLDSDAYNTMQKFNGRLLGGVFRIDINYTIGSTLSHPIIRQPSFSNITVPATAHPDAVRMAPAAVLGTNHTYSQGYGIPNDNPWVDATGGRLEEYYAIGVRSPHTMTYDPLTGDIWLGDVGQAAWEEVDKIIKGGDYQWPYKEGNDAFFDPDWGKGTITKAHTLPSTQVPPVVAYGRAEGNAVIGGYVYRGREHAAALYGKYLFTDHGNPSVSHIWSLAPGSSTPTLLTDMTAGGFHWNVAAWGRDAEGELYLVRLGLASGANTENAFIPPLNASGQWITKAENGKIFKLARTTTNVPEPPALLSNVGALAPFTATSGLTPNAAFIPYTPAAPFWSDAAVKSRWVAIPNDGTPDAVTGFVGYSTTAEWTFPEGTVFMKHFDIGTSDVNPLSTRRLETRFFVKGPTAWYGLTYRWRTDQTNADLLFVADTAALTIATATGSRNQTWSFPSRSDCLTCHTALAGAALGFKVHQLNNKQFYPITGRTENQLETFSSLGFFSPAPSLTDIAAAPRSPSPTDVSAPLELRAKAYLDSNCATCHRPGGANANWDGRYGSAMTATGTGIINGSLKKIYGVANEAVVRPFSPSSSILYLRSHLLGGTGSLTQMPPLGKSILDVTGEQLLFDWISVAGLEGKYFSNTTFTGGSALTRSDAQLNFSWTGTPGSPVTADNFSVRWTGRVFGNQTGPHQLFVNSDGGIRLYVHGQLVIDRWTNSTGAVESSATVPLALGNYADFILEKYSTTGTATAELRWSGSGLTKALIPSANLTAMPAGETRPVAAGDAFTVQRGLANQITPAANDTDSQGILNPATITILTQPTYGTLTVDAQGTVLYTNNNHPSATDSATYLIADSAGNTSLPATITFTVQARHVAWRNSVFSPTELANPAISSWDKDPDQDGLNNLLEWALGGDPKVNTPLPRPSYTLVDTPGGKAVRFTFPKRASNDTILVAETSANLSLWNPSNPNVQVIEDSAQRFVVQLPQPASGPLFLRVRVTLPAP